MAFSSQGLRAIYQELRKRQRDAERFSLLEFDDAEYTILLDSARRIIQELRSSRYARTVFLAFACEFVRRTKYTGDNIFWSEFERTLGLKPMEKRGWITDQLLWPAYKDVGIPQKRGRKNRRIVGSLVSEVQRSAKWLRQARSKFINFFKWYYRHYPDEEISQQLIAHYQKETRDSLYVPDKILSTFARDCRTLAKVIDYAIENGLYLEPTELDKYRAQIVDAIQQDPLSLNLIRDQRTLVSLIQELQNHMTAIQFKQILRQRRSGHVTSPWGNRSSASRALKRWQPFPYGIYRLDEQEYRVVPHPRLRLEMIDRWPLEQIVIWKGARSLGYKKTVPFRVTVGRRNLKSRQYWRAEEQCFHLWVDEAPVGEKLVVDGRLCAESAGAAWDLGLKLNQPSGSDPVLSISIDRLMLYFPRRPHQSIRIWTSTGYLYTDNLREDGVRRFHLHHMLKVPLPDFNAPVHVYVAVGEEEVLSRTFPPDPNLLFSLTSGEQVRMRTLADTRELKYLLLTQSTTRPQPGPGVSVLRRPEPYGLYTIHEVIWEDSSLPFELEVESERWFFKRRWEFIPFLRPSLPIPPLQLKPHQYQRFADVSLSIFSNRDLEPVPLSLEIGDTDGVLAQFDLKPYIIADAPDIYSVRSALWKDIEKLTVSRWGQYWLRFQSDEVVLGDLNLSIVPHVEVEWDGDMLCSENEAIPFTVRTPCPAWDPSSGQTETCLQLTVRPKTQLEPWSKHTPLRRLVPEPASVVLAFSELGESLDISIEPRSIFGFRLYLERGERRGRSRWHTSYQPIELADYYQLTKTVLYLSSSPESRVDILQGDTLVWSGQSDLQGDILLEKLSFLREFCSYEQTIFVIRCENLEKEFIVQWAPLLDNVTLDGDTATLQFQGPLDTGLKVALHDEEGQIWQTWHMPCKNRKNRSDLSLPQSCRGTCYLVVEYVLSNGETRPAAQQLVVPGKQLLQIPSSWLEEGIGLATQDELSQLGWEDS